MTKRELLKAMAELDVKICMDDGSTIPAAEYTDNFPDPRDEAADCLAAYHAWFQSERPAGKLAREWYAWKAAWTAARKDL